MDIRETLETVLGVFEHFEPSLPDEYRTAPYVFLGNMHPGLQLHVLDQMTDAKFVLADTMDLWINITRDDLETVISRVNMLTLNESEARLLTDTLNLSDAAAQLLEMGPEFVLIKKGENGSMLFSRDGIYIQPAFPMCAVEDPTGAGDTFAGALMCWLAEAGSHTEVDIRRAMVHGSVVASFGVEAFSLEQLQKLKRDEITDRVSGLRDMMRVDL
jgi:sugar/nucleoside kinase (ribokinase family)